MLYVADLDGIEGRGRNAGLARVLAAAVPNARLWIDDGTPAREAAQRIAQERNATLVIGSESLGGLDDVAALRALPRDRYVLSLDFKDDRFAGPRQVLDEAQHWPDAVIVMTLARVGSGDGPDLHASQPSSPAPATAASTRRAACATAPISKRCMRPAPPARSSPRHCTPER